MTTRKLVLIVAGITGGAATLAAGVFLASELPISTGKRIAPVGTNAEVGSFPVNMLLSPDGKFLVVSDAGFREQLSVIDVSSGQVVGKLEFDKTNGNLKEQIYYGLAFGPDGKLYVSRGQEDKVSIVDIDANGTPTIEQNEISIPSAKPDEPNYVAGLAVSADGQTLVAAENETYYHLSDGKLVGGRGRLAVIDLAARKVATQLEIGGFPYDVKVATGGVGSGRVFATSEKDGIVDSIDLAQTPSNSTVGTPIATGANPSMMAFDHAQRRLYVSNSNSDTVSIIDPANNEVLSTILLRPPQARGLPGCTPLGQATSTDDKMLFVAMADLNAVAVVDTASGKVSGYIPCGWYPTSVAVSKDNRWLFVADGKGVKPRVPNDKSVDGHGTYIQNVIEGTVQRIDLGQAMSRLRRLTEQVLVANRFVHPPARPFNNPHPKHVFYIIKENRTYDQVLGDIPKGNGDPSVCMFGKDVTPNQHALAERFGLFDNFYVAGEVSADGWNWSTAGIGNEYTERNTIVNYSGRGRSYDFAGQTNDLPNDDFAVRDVAEPPGGYIWDAAAKSGIDFRNYGFYVNSNDEKSEFPFQTRATKKLLDAKTDHDFREFDMAYTDSDAWVKLGKHYPKQKLEFGSHKEPCRFSEWKLEFDAYVRDGNLPPFIMIALPHNHTQGTAPGYATPSAMVADNDYAVGELVEAISHSPYWKDSVICILEDDAQNGRDHVDCHRSPTLIISPYCRRGQVDHRFWNTDSMLRTIEEMLGMAAMNQYDGFASPIDAFGLGATNSEPYTAEMPSAAILTAVNSVHAYRAKDSERILNALKADQAPDEEFNDILWHAVKG